MGVYTRFKRNPDGLRALVQLLETTPKSRRDRMIEVGRAEDPDFTERALALVMNFDDVTRLPDLELAEVLAKVPPRVMAFALGASGDEVKARFVKFAKPQIGAEIRDYLSVKIGPSEISGAQLKVIEATRQLEHAGKVKAKKIPG